MCLCSVVTPANCEARRGVAASLHRTPCAVGDFEPFFFLRSLLSSEFFLRNVRASGKRATRRTTPSGNMNARFVHSVPSEAEQFIQQISLKKEIM